MLFDCYAVDPSASASHASPEHVCREKNPYLVRSDAVKSKERRRNAQRLSKLRRTMYVEDIPEESPCELEGSPGPAYDAATSEVSDGWTVIDGEDPPPMYRVSLLARMVSLSSLLRDRMARGARDKSGIIM